MSEALEIALTKINIEAGHNAVANLALSRGASIEGTVTYDDGGPGISLPVQLFRRDSTGSWKPYLNSSGTSVMAPLGLGPHTDDKGRYYEPGLPRGDYVVEISLRGSIMMPASIVGKQELKVAIKSGDALQIYSGNQYRLSEAKPIKLHDGEVRVGADIEIATVGLHLINGSVTDKETGETISLGKVGLQDSVGSTTLRETSSDMEGRFTFNYVPSGVYRLKITSHTMNREGKPTIDYNDFVTQLRIDTDLSDGNFALTKKRR